MKFLGLGMVFLYASSGLAYPVLPYSVRTLGYSGWGSNVRGDSNTVGMAGATVAIPSSISAAESNPAGFGMETPSVAAQIISDTIHDDHYQKSGETYDSNQWGLGVSPPHWGFGITYYSPMTESGHYISPNTGHTLDTEVSIKELRFTVARSFLRSRLSLGLSLEIAKATRKLGDYTFHNQNVDFVVGALYRLDDHMILGISIMPQVTIPPALDGFYQTELPGFNQPIVSPTKIDIGMGWIPNRFFKVGAGVYYTAATDGTALLADQSKRVGANATYEPRVGASYVIAEYKAIKIEWALGSYYEPSRVQGEEGRFHATTGLDVNPYFINLSVGADLANGYRNNSASIGLDIVRTARVLGIIPKDPVRPIEDFFPMPMHVSADGLPNGMTEGEKKGQEGPSLNDVGKIIEDIPDRIREQIGAIPEPPPVPKRTHHRRKKLKLPPFPDGGNP